MVAMEQPLDIVALDDLRVLTGYNIQAVVVTDSELEAAIKITVKNVSVEQALAEVLTPETEEAEAFTADEESDKPAVQLANIILSQAVSAKAVMCI